MNQRLPFRIELRPLLISGGIFSEPGQHLVPGVVIYLDSEQSEEQRTIALWHETVHLLLMASGIPAEQHNEDQVEAIAQKLAQACPEILQVCRLSSAGSAAIGTAINPFEKAVREWLKGCSCARPAHPGECDVCTQAFLDHIKNIPA